MATTRITQNVIFLNNKTIDDIDGNGDLWIPKGGENAVGFKTALSASDTIVFESHGAGNEHLNAIYARGKKFGGGISVNTDANKISANGAEYTLVINNNGKLEIQKFVPITKVSISGDRSWERDSGQKTNVTLTASCDPENVSTPITFAWANIGASGATLPPTSGNTIKLSTIQNNAIVKYKVTATQEGGTYAEDTYETSWWTRKAAVICSPNADLYSSLTGITTGGFKFTIAGTTYSTTTTGGYIPGTTTNGLSDFKLSKSFGRTYTGFIYILCSDNKESFTKYITKNGKKGLAQETFTRVSTTPIKTYSDEAQSLYLYRSNGQQADISSIALTDN